MKTSKLILLLFIGVLAIQPVKAQNRSERGSELQTVQNQRKSHVTHERQKPFLDLQLFRRSKKRLCIFLPALFWRSLQHPLRWR